MEFGATMTILVTGSSGHLVEALMRTSRPSGRAAIGLDRIPGPYTDEVGSIADRPCVKRAVAGAEAVLHSAASTPKINKPPPAPHDIFSLVEVLLWVQFQLR
jgi:UDP-glucose 4-epimerase